MRQHAAGMVGAKVIAPRYAVIAAMLVGIAIALMKGDIVTNDVNLSPVIPAFIAHTFH